MRIRVQSPSEAGTEHEGDLKLQRTFNVRREALYSNARRGQILRTFQTAIILAREIGTPAALTVLKEGVIRALAF